MQIAAKISQALIDAVKYASQHSPYYREKLGEVNFDQFGIDEFQKIAFTTKDDLAANNELFRSIKQQQVFDIVTTSGTTGNPVSFYLSLNDMDRLADNEARSLALTGATSDDRFQLMTTMNKQFMAGLAYYEGIKKLGGGILRVGPGSIKNQWDTILQHKPTYLIAIPSFVPLLINEAEKMGIDYQNCSVKSIVCIGEPIRDPELNPNALHLRISEKWDVNLYSTYASTEMATAYTECKEHKGCHELSDLIYTEVLDDQGNPVANAESGEVVITPLGVEAMPLVRYKTGDICKVFYDKCSCGNPSLRLGPITGRKDHRIKYKGTTIYPRTIQLFLAQQEVWPYSIIIDSNEEGNDNVTILCTNRVDPDELKEAMQNALSVSPEIRLISNEAIVKVLNWKSSRKPKLVVDIRNNQEAKGFIGSL
ncbi:MAG: phenylacetate-CoA ligase [Parvicellaceae bacterium]|jgi:phenylacetate-CoA ligase